MSNKIQPFLKDMNATAKRLANKTDSLVELSFSEITQIKESLETYSPKTEPGHDCQIAALKNIASYLKSLDKEKISGKALQSKQTGADKQGEAVAAKTATLYLSIKQPGFVKKISSHLLVDTLTDGHTENSSINPDSIRVNQDIINRKELKDLAKHRGEMIKFIKDHCVPNKYMARGMYLMPLRLTQKIDDKILAFMEKRETLLDAFEAKYEEIKEEAKKERGFLYDEMDYPEFSQIRSKYQVYARYLSFNVPQAIEKLNKEIYEREQKNARLDWEDAAQEVRNALRIGFQDLVDHLISRLGKDENGSSKVFHQARVTKLRDFIETFQDRNLTSDAELSGLVTKARAIVENVDTGKISRDSDLRTSLEKSFSEIKKHADSLVVTKPTRAFDLSD